MADYAAGVDLVFWSSCVRNQGFREQVAAAVAGGFKSFAIMPATYRRAIASGLSPKDIKAFAADRGVFIKYLDTLTDWAPIRVPREISPVLKESFDITLDQSFAIVDALELTTILAVGGYDEKAVPLPALIDGFGKLCDKAKTRGVWIDLEFMPHWGLRDLAAAWEIVGGAACDNSGILIDTWHLTKGTFDLDLLRSLPGKYFVGVQVADAMKRQRGSTLYEEGSRYRKFPGEGEMPIVEVLRLIKHKGHLRYVGPEVFSDEADEMSPEDAGRKSGDTIRKVLKAAQIAVAEPGIA